MPMMKMLKLSEYNFTASPVMPGVSVIFPSREIYFSPEAMNTMRMTADTCPKTLDQWYELFHPEDHTATAKLEHAIYSSHEAFVSMVRRLYCGDGHYRKFRLDAFIQRDRDNRPVKLMGSETLALGAWLSTASEGDVIECGNGRVLEAVRVQGMMTLKDIGEIEDMRRENMALRREIQRRIFGASFSMPSPEEDMTGLRNILEENISLALNVLTGNNQLKALRRSMNEPALTIGIAGLTGSGKTAFMNALLGEKLIPEASRAVIFCREGEFRAAKVYYQDGRAEEVRGQELTASYMKRNSGAARIDIVMPGALIPDGLCFASTPSFDALAGSGSAALKNILPELDITAYITPVRSRLKGSDYAYLKMILALSKNIVFILSQTDLERDDTEAGKVIHSIRAKIHADIQAIREDMKKFSGLDVDVIPVSAKKALEKFYDRKNPDWQNSNIEGVVKYFARFSNEAYTRAMIYRAERISAVLEGASARREVSGSSRWRVGNITESLKRCAQYTLPEISGYVYDEVSEPEKAGKNLLSSVMESMREGQFRTKFFELEAFKHGHKAILLGADRSQSMKLFARLVHNLMLEDEPAQGWLLSGDEVPSVGSDASVMIAPADAEIAANIDWRKIFSEYVPVVSVDLARVDSGLYDLMHSPYIARLAFTDWVLAFGNAGLFDTRQIELVSHVPKRVKEFAGMNGIKSPEWFIYENYKIF